MKTIIISLMSCGILLTIILSGCDKTPTEIEKTKQAEKEIYSLSELEPLPPNPDIEKEVEFLFKEQGIEKGDTESIKNVKVIEPEEYAMYNINPPTESEIRSMVERMNKPSDVLWPPPYPAYGAFCYGVNPPPGQKMVYTGAASMITEYIDRICCGQIIYVDGNPKTSGGYCLDNTNFISTHCYLTWPESETHRVDNYSSHIWRDSEAFLPDQEITAQDHCYTVL